MTFPPSKRLSSERRGTAGARLFTMQELTCEGLDAWALEKPGRAVVVVQLLVGEVEAGVDAAVLLRDLHIVKIRGGSHGGGQRGGRAGGRQSASSGKNVGGWIIASKRRLMSETNRKKRLNHTVWDKLEIILTFI